MYRKIKVLASDRFDIETSCNELNIVFGKNYFIPIRQKMVIAEFFDYDLNSLNFMISVHNLSNLQPEDERKCNK